MNDVKKAAAFRQGLFVMIALAVLTGAEYGISLLTQSAAFLFILALLKAALVAQYFMHIARLWSSEESHG